MKEGVLHSPSGQIFDVFGTSVESMMCLEGLMM
jgi:hypothetical protein